MKTVIAALVLATGLGAATSAQAHAVAADPGAAAPMVVPAHSYDRPYYRPYYRPYAPRALVRPFAGPPVIVQRYRYELPSRGYGYRGLATDHCREYRTRMTIDGRRRNAYGLACLQPDGTWRLVN